MVSKMSMKDINYTRIVTMLKILLDEEKITWHEYELAKQYYRKMTRAEIVLGD